MNVTAPHIPRGVHHAPRGSIVSRSRGSVTSLISSRVRVKRGQRDADSLLDEMLRHMGGETAEEALDVILRAVAVRRQGPPAVRSGPPLWQHVLSAVAVANAEGLRRTHAAYPAEEVLFFFEKAAKLVEAPPRAPPAPPAPQRPARRKSVTLPQARPASAAPAPKGVGEFAAFPSLRKYLLGTVLSNKAFVQQAAGEAPGTVVRTLLDAAKERNAVFSTFVLYNLAVALVSWERFDEAADVVACCTEISDAILTADFTPSHDTATIFSDFRVSVAKHAIMCHNLLAALAAWCALPDTELYHCHLALCCAKKFLPDGCPAAARCARRYAAAQEGTGLILDDSGPPALPMLTDDLALVTHPMFSVFLREAGAIRLPPSAARSVACVEAIFSPKKEKADRGKLPGLKARAATSLAAQKRPSLAGREKLPALRGARKASLSSARGRHRAASSVSSVNRTRSSLSASSTGRQRLNSRAHSWGMLSSRGRGRGNTMKLPALSPMLSAKVEALRQTECSALATISPRSDGLYSTVSDDEASEAPQPILTLMPEPAYTHYKGLKREMKRMMHTFGFHADSLPAKNAFASTTESAGPPEAAPVRPRAFSRILGAADSIATAASAVQASVDLRVLTVATATALAPPPDEYMRVMDKKLLRLSKIAPDPHFGQWLYNIVCIQSLWRGRKARQAYRVRHAALCAALRFRKAAEVLQYAYRTYKATRPFVLERHARTARRLFIGRVTLVQRELRALKSVEHCGRLLCASLRQRLAARVEFLRRTRAAVFIQCWWRVRNLLRRRFASALRLQCVWRGRKARVRARDLRVRRRLAAQCRERALTLAARPVQRRWRGILAVRAAKAEVRRRLFLVTAALDAADAAFDVQCAALRIAPDALRHMGRVLAVLRGHHCRVALFAQMRARRVLTAFLLRVVFRRRGTLCVLPQLRKEALLHRRTMRRREDVADAAVRIQTRVRIVLAKAELAARRKRHMALTGAARVLQRALRSFCSRRLLAAAAAEARRRALMRRELLLRTDGAAVIQRWWRAAHAMHCSGDFRRFQREGRHRIARVIQCWWRMCVARAEFIKAQRRREERTKERQRWQIRVVAAIRVQSAARMFLVRSALRRTDGLGLFLLLPHTPARRQRAARTIQCAWRKFAAREYVQQLRLARAYYEQRKAAAEAQHTYAAMIQSVVRGWILRRRPRSDADTEREGLSTDGDGAAQTEPKQRRQERVCVMEYALRSSEERYTAEYVHEWFEEEEEEEEEEEKDREECEGTACTTVGVVEEKREPEIKEQVEREKQVEEEIKEEEEKKEKEEEEKEEEGTAVERECA